MRILVLVCIVLVVMAIACLAVGFLALTDPEGRGGKYFAAFALAALALIVAAIGMWFV